MWTLQQIARLHIQNARQYNELENGCFWNVREYNRIAMNLRPIARQYIEFDKLRLPIVRHYNEIGVFLGADLRQHCKFEQVYFVVDILK